MVQYNLYSGPSSRLRRECKQKQCACKLNYSIRFGSTLFAIQPVLSRYTIKLQQICQMAVVTAEGVKKSKLNALTKHCSAKHQK